MNPLAFVDEELQALERSGLLRRLRRVGGTQGPTLRLDGREVLNFSSNNYLGLAGDAEITQAASATLAESGLGAGASRLISGNMGAHAELEKALADYHGTEAARLFNSGYQANVGVLSALAGRGDLICSDELNHASIIDGCRLSKAEVRVFPHRDVGAAAAALGTPARRRFVVTDSVFSMDGDRQRLVELGAVATRHGAALIVDEAHAVGVLGPSGRGLAAEVGVIPDVTIGTLGKAFGSFGAYAAGSRALVDFLGNRARAFVFTTALPPSVCAASRSAVALVSSARGHGLRSALRGHIERFSRGLARLGLAAPNEPGAPIFPIHCGTPQATMDACEYLLGEAIFAQGIRPPTVPRGTSRLRFALMATHTPAHVDAALDALASALARRLVPRVRP